MTLSPMLEMGKYEENIWTKDSLFSSEQPGSYSTCFPPEAIVKKGHHRVVCMQSDMRLSGTQEPIEDEYTDENGNLF